MTGFIFGLIIGCLIGFFILGANRNSLFWQLHVVCRNIVASGYLSGPNLDSMRRLVDEIDPEGAEHD